jgi:hypothetical protein
MAFLDWIGLEGQAFYNQLHNLAALKEIVSFVLVFFVDKKSGRILAGCLTKR